MVFNFRLSFFIVVLPAFVSDVDGALVDTERVVIVICVVVVGAKVVTGGDIDISGCLLGLSMRAEKSNTEMYISLILQQLL